MPRSIGKNALSVPGMHPTPMGVHFFRAPAQRTVSRLKGQLATLVVVFSGVYEARLATSGASGAVVRAGPGDVVYWPANADRTEENDPERPTECIVIRFRWPEAPAGLARVVRDTGGLIRMLALRLLAFKETAVTVPIPVWKAYLPTIMAEHIRLSLEREDPLVARTADYVERHLAEPFKLGDLSAAVGLNRFYLGRAFKRRTGMTPMEFVRRKRVEHAVGMLASNWSTPRMIAPRVGIADVAQLRALLRRYTGMSVKALTGLARHRESLPVRWTTDRRSGAARMQL